MIQPNSDKLFRLKRKASAVNFESVSKSTLSNCMSFNHCTTECNPKASATSTDTVQRYVKALAITNVPSASQTQIPIHVRLA
ncbi:hypothetical protein MTR_3g049760 [Medicago truncatula]|uniref:Uncharacterized protein n=1 Tax=Medicago truncatula TaxID=3880 RepID=A0A072UXM2_MEDTR|nr:hypothetical protein MTR_3g049760 [Medicago truncatula]